MVNISSSNPTVTNVSFANNPDGGMINVNSRPVLTNVTFSGNYARLGGGGIYNSNSHLIYYQHLTNWPSFFF